MNIARTTPSEEPITTAEAKAYLQIEHTADDTYIDTLITAARVRFENLTSRALITQAITILLDSHEVDQVTFDIPIRPIITLTSFKSIDIDGAKTTFTSGTDFVTSGLDPMLIIGRDGYPPEMLHGTYEIIGSFGYGAAAAVPQDIKTCLKTLVADWYISLGSVTEAGEKATAKGAVNASGTPGSAQQIIDSYRSYVSAVM